MLVSSLCFHVQLVPLRVGAHNGNGARHARPPSRSNPQSNEHISGMQKEFDTRTRVFEDDADFIVEVREGSSTADMDPEFELKELGARFEAWRKDFKDRLKETRTLLKRLDKFEERYGEYDAAYEPCIGP